MVNERMGVQQSTEVNHKGVVITTSITVGLKYDATRVLSFAQLSASPELIEVAKKEEVVRLFAAVWGKLHG